MSAEAAHAMYDPNVTLVELATSTAVNWTKIVADQRKERNRLDREMPRDILLAVTAVVLFGMLMTHARFFARLYASLPLPSRSSASATRGGDLAQGWFFRQGKLALESTTVYDEKMQEEIVPQTAPPPHVRPLLAYLPYSSALLFAPLSRFPNPFRSYMSIPQLFFILCLVFLAVFSLSYRADMTPSTKHKGNGEDYMRSGEVSMSLMPVAIALAVRGNIVGLCVSNGYEKLRIFHKVVGRLIFVATVIHTVGYCESVKLKATLIPAVVKWVRADNVNEHAYLGYVIWGYVALIALFIMVVSSLPMIRNMWYGVFKVCHVAGVILMIVALGFHRPRAMPYA
ncbi:hypothetical protein IAR55_005597 [Kwoniella newhampshirensis]|uniref:Ferric oxidoreductase domain-containing protein n=1 Tax=Kwoniella newhampshirensis TaxID=1651941 RepID=A0AAW0YSJ6_9TREE